MATFIAPFVTNLCVTAMVIFRACQVERPTNQLPSQPCWQAYRGAIMNAIEGCVILLVIVLNVLSAYSQRDSEQNTVSDI
jgi:hypothetical protein